MRYLGIDFGLKKIGLAVSEGEIASPWQILDVRSFKESVEKTSKIINDGDFQKVIIGMPEGKMAKNVRGFINALIKNGITVSSVPETLSSKRAMQKMIEQGVGQKSRRREDAYSAAEILQNYLDTNRIKNLESRI